MCSRDGVRGLLAFESTTSWLVCPGVADALEELTRNLFYFREVDGGNHPALSRYERNNSYTAFKRQALSFVPSGLCSPVT